MSRELNIILAIVAGLLVVCACIGVVGLVLFQRVSTSVIQGIGDPTSAARAASEIADWEIPAGYEQEAIGLLGLNMVVITPPEGQEGHVIALAQVPTSAGLTRRQVEEKLQGTIEERMQRKGMTLQEVGEETVTIRGQPVTLNIREGQDENGEEFRQASGVFEGRGGPALLMITASTSTWDPDFVDEFIASVQ